eukprot:scaffold5757_cov75-Skeletonema_marinoi.AAC.1
MRLTVADEATRCWLPHPSFTRCAPYVSLGDTYRNLGNTNPTKVSIRYSATTEKAYTCIVCEENT